MWVVVVSTGLRGDVEPYVHLAAGLEKKGHRVTLVVNTVHLNLVLSLLRSNSSVEFVGLKGDPEALQRNEDWQRLVATRNIYYLLLTAQRFAEPDYAANGRTLLRRLTKEKGVKPAVLVANPNMWLTCIPLAEGLRIPLVHVSLLPPPLPCTAYPPPTMHSRPLPFGLLNLLAGWGQQNLVVASNFDLVPRIYSFQADAGSPYIELPQYQVRLRVLPTALAYPSLLFPPPSVWSSFPITPCGALRDPSPALDPSTNPTAWSLQAFLDANPDDKPVLISFGALQGVRDDLARLAIGALYVTHRRGILVRGWAGVSSSDLDPTDPEEAQMQAYAKQRVFELEAPVPFAWLLPRCAAVVHHGGAGTTAAALHAGVPQVVVPVLEDQFFWAARVADVGVAFSHAIPGQELSADTLAGMISQVLGDEVVARAKEVAEEASREDGVDAVIRVVEGEAAKGGQAFWNEVYRGVARENRWKVFRARVVVVGILAGLGTVTYLTVKRLTRRSGGR